VQQPGGQPKQISKIKYTAKAVPVNGRASETDFTHTCDTVGSSSGSPVFNEAGQVVGLHHYGFGSGGEWNENRAIRIIIALRIIFIIKISSFSDSQSVLFYKSIQLIYFMTGRGDAMKNHIEDSRGKKNTSILNQLTRRQFITLSATALGTTPLWGCDWFQKDDNLVHPGQDVSVIDIHTHIYNFEDLPKGFIDTYLRDYNLPFFKILVQLLEYALQGLAPGYEREKERLKRLLEHPGERAFVIRKDDWEKKWEEEDQKTFEEFKKRINDEINKSRSFRAFSVE
jgi:hypothetical protein